MILAAQDRNVTFLGVIQGGSGRPDRRVPVVAAGHLLQAWVGGATQSARASVAVVLIEAIQLAHSWRRPRAQPTTLCVLTACSRQPFRSFQHALVLKLNVAFAYPWGAHKQAHICWAVGVVYARVAQHMCWPAAAQGALRAKPPIERRRCPSSDFSFRLTPVWSMALGGRSGAVSP